jgi:hypothetical protein
MLAIDGVETSFWGCRWGDQTKFAVLDIDAGSNYHNEISLQRIKQALCSAGFSKPKLYKSSDSEGWHLYLFFDQWADSRDVKTTLKSWLSLNSFEIKTGQLEIFPSNNGLRFPLQNGFAWLDAQNKIEISRSDLTTDQAIKRFVADSFEFAHNWDFCESLIKTQIQAIEQSKTNDAQDVPEISEDGFSALFSNQPALLELYDRGRNYWKTGLTSENQRHDAILSLGQYLWYGDEQEGLLPLSGLKRAEQRARLIGEWFQRGHNGFCEAINRGAWVEVESDIKRACYWTARSPQKRIHQPYPLTDRLINRLVQLKTLSIEDLQNANNKREDDARGKIRRAVEQCQAIGQQISRQTLKAMTGCSVNTIRRHGDLWRHLAIGSGECSSPGVAVLPAPSGLESFCDSQEVRSKEIGLSALSDSDIPSEVQENEKTERQGLGLVVAPPLLSCLANEPTTCTQRKDRALRVPSEVLTPGPGLRGIQAVLQDSAGGVFSMPTRTYTAATAMRAQSNLSSKQRSARAYPAAPGWSKKQRKRGPPTA